MLARYFLLLLAAAPVSAAAQSPAHGEAFDRLDRRAREFIATIRCALRVAEARALGRFGPPDSLGGTGHCLFSGGRRLGVFLDVDSAWSVTRFAAVDLADNRRYAGTLDTAAVVARTRALYDAVERGSPAFAAAGREFGPVVLWPHDDSLQVWLIPIETLGGQKPTALGGERGFFYTRDGRNLASEIDARTAYRAVQISDTGAVHIESMEQELPFFSEMVLANFLNEAGRPVTIVTARLSSSLTGRGPAAMWIHVRR